MKHPRIHDLRQRTIELVDGMFAETVRLSFMKNGTTDPARPQREIDAILRVNAGSSMSLNGGGVDFKSRFIVAGGELHIDRAKYPDLVVRKDDRVRAMVRPGQPLFAVASVDDRNTGRLVLQLGAV